ncbi:hypothetical protein ASPZODRAFT_127227 [Penicilliopsis zonata CBS 506.65]|uniref:DNA-directed RNA polymerase III RPC4 n=1 Tax=Penicilliopsis zonata CBS 506.65 TaxID=1073090 RepID=A0A1L9SVP1_9EURO|nr:hypothetical protein ASPZODRAFT_127227 [Penicilliopsis zonata CBS 506.65]OJJ51204.1 hypothetical protein ASPZODRAFT_127227 [Penicilliopsis zonata CBS 506.65]
MPPKAAPRRTATRRQPAPEPEAGTAASSTSGAVDPVGQNESVTPSEGGSRPASTRPPVQRLQSLKKRTPAGSIAPATKKQPSALGGGPAGDGSTTKPTLKYQPKAVMRRSKEEREALEKLEAERNRERLAEVAAIRRGRGDGGRGAHGRGGQGGRGGARRGRGGIFSVDSSRASSMSRRSRSIIDAGGAGGRGGEDYSSDEDREGLRISIDEINLESDSEDDYGDSKKGKMAARNSYGGVRALRPIRVERYEHEERVVSVNMESSTTSKPAEETAEEEADPEDLTAEDDNTLFVEQDAPDDTHVKQEPADGDEVMTDDIPHADDTIITDDGFLPEQTVKVRRKLQAKEAPAPAPATVTIAAAPTKKKKDPRDLLRTKEELEEYDRHLEDLDAVKDLLYFEPKEPAPATVTTEKSKSPVEAGGEGDKGEDKTGEKEEEEKEEEETEEEPTNEKLAGQLFLMQFPPMTPNLVVSGSTNEQPGDREAEPRSTQPGPLGGVKREQQDGDDDALEVTGESVGAPPHESSKIVTATNRQLHAGRVGKLNVHASGRVTMDWGGISFELDRATAVGFLQEALIVSAPSHDLTTGEVMPDEKRVWAMGQLSGKFTVMPNWEEIL